MGYAARQAAGLEIVGDSIGGADSVRGRDRDTAGELLLSAYGGLVGLVGGYCGNGDRVRGSVWHKRLVAWTKSGEIG